MKNPGVNDPGDDQPAMTNPPFDAVAPGADDNVATLLRAASAGETLNVSQGNSRRRVECSQALAAFHKLALEDLETGSAVIKYGYIIGSATQPIKTGAHVHVHNIATRRGPGAGS